MDDAGALKGVAISQKWLAAALFKMGAFIEIQRCLC